MIKNFTSFSTGQLSIPSEFAQELHIELLKIDIKREKFLSVLLIAIATVLLLVPEKSTGEIILLRTVLLLVPLVFLVCTFFKNKLNIKLFQALHLVLNLIVLILCPVMAVISESWQQPFSYVVSLFLIASMVFFSKWERIIVYLSSYFVYVAGILMFHSKEDGLLSSSLFMLILVIAAFYISANSYSAFASAYINNKIISEKNMELDKLNRITEQTLERRTEELHKAVEYEKLRTNFFANISHELRTPLTLIFSAQQMIDLKTRKTDTGNGLDAQKYIRIIRQNCYRLMRLISNLIDITKFNAGYIKPNFHNYNIVKVVRDISMSVDNFIESKGIQLFFASEIQDAVIAIDFEMLERIMLNLLSNAVKFTPEGGSVSVKIFDCGDMIKISVKDTGIGIPEHMHALVFERFVQVDYTHTKKREGSGIGLSLVKSMVDLHKGTIALKSREGEGTEITVCLPKNKLPFREECGNIENERSMEKINIELSDIYS